MSAELEARVAAVFAEAALPRHAAMEAIRLVRSQIEQDIESLHIPGAPCVGDESYNAAIADAARTARSSGESAAARSAETGRGDVREAVRRALSQHEDDQGGATYCHADCLESALVAVLEEPKP